MGIFIGMGHLFFYDIVYVFNPINNDNQILWRRQNIVGFHMPSVVFTPKAGLYIYILVSLYSFLIGPFVPTFIELDIISRLICLCYLDIMFSGENKSVCD